MKYTLFHEKTPARPKSITGVLTNLYGENRQRSISPMTMSMLPTMAGTSAIRQPAQIGLVTLRLRKLDDFARQRSGTLDLPGEPTTWKPIAPRGHSVSTYASPAGRWRAGSMRWPYFSANALSSFAA